MHRKHLQAWGPGAVLLSLVLLCALALAVSSAKGESGEESASDAMPPAGDIPVKELPEERTATSATFERHSGLLEARVYDKPINYKDAEGDWQPIEEGLEETDDGEIVNGASSVDVSLPSELQEGVARLTIGEEWIASKPLSIDTEPAEVDNGAAVYDSPTASTVLEYTTLPEGLKEDIVLEDPSSPSSIRFALTVSPGLSPDLIADGSILFKDRQGEVVASMPAPTVADADMSAPSTDQVSYQLAPRDSGGWVVTVAVDPDWLDAPGRAWPIHIDPTVTKEGSALDCVIGGKTGQEGWIDCASWGRNNLLASYTPQVNQAEDTWTRSLLYLKTAELIQGADLVSADLMLHAPEGAWQTSGVAVHQVLKPWNIQANWKRYAFGKNWEAEGGDYAPEPLGLVKVAERGAGPGWWSVPIQIGKVAEAAAKDQNLSVILKLLDDKSRSCTPSSCARRIVVFDSSTVEPYNRPYLRVLYDFQKAPTTSKMSSPEEGRTTSHFFTLQSTWAPTGFEGTGVTYQFKQPYWDHFKKIPTEDVINGKGEEVHWPIAVGASSSQSEPLFFDFKRWANPNSWPHEYDDIKLRAVFTGGPSSRGATEPVTVRYIDQDRGIGGATDASLSVGPANLDLLTGFYSISRSDVSVPVPGSDAQLEFTRTYQSNWQWKGQQTTSYALGDNWQPSAPVEQDSLGVAWTKLVELHQPAIPAQYGHECWEESGETFCEEWLEEEPIPEATWVELTDSEGGTVTFDLVGGNYVAPDYMKGWILSKSSGNFLLAGPEGVKTTFVPNTGGAAGEFRPTTVSWQANQKSVRMVYTLPEGSKKYRLAMEIAPAPPGVAACPDTEPWKTAGCRTLRFNYFSCSCWGNYRLGSIAYHDATGSSGSAGETVAQYGYDSEYRLIREWDPRTAGPNGRVLEETYTYAGAGLATLTPPGQEPWNFTYYTPEEFQLGPWEETGLPEYNPSDVELFRRLKTVSRATLVESTPSATTSIVYQVPVSGSGAPYDMSPSTIAKWGQSDLPLDATAVFPPDQVPTTPHPTDFSHATIHYLDAEGYEINTASPALPGAGGPSLSTSETDMHGNVIRELSPQNRLRSLAAGASSAARSRELDNHSVYNSDGTEMLETWGPLHQVRLENGETTNARLHTVVEYKDPTPPAEQAPYHLPTKQTTGAAVSGRSEDADQQATELTYWWNLRKVAMTVVDPGVGHLNAHFITTYDESTGQVTDAYQPKWWETQNETGRTRFIYYQGGTGSGECYNAQYAGLPCKVMPGSQESGTGRPELLVKWFKAYNSLDEPTEIVESAGGKEVNARKTLLEYDKAGRQARKRLVGGGQPIPKVETEYDEYQGLPLADRFKCESECGNPQFLTSVGAASETSSAVKTPADAVVDASGNIWVADKGNNRVVEYSTGGTFVREVASLGSNGGKLSAPSGIMVDPGGKIWVADTANNRVVALDGTGGFLLAIGRDVNKTKVEAAGTETERNFCTAASGNICQAGIAGSSGTQLNAPQGIASTNGGNVWVADTGNSRLKKYNPSTGALFNNIGGEGSGAGQVKNPTAIVVAADNSFWVADTGNNRIEKFSSTPSFVQAVGKEGLGSGEFKKPAGIEIDSSGKVWVSEQEGKRVQKFGEAGEFLLKFGTAGTQEGQFGSPAGITSDGKGNLFLVDAGNNRAQKWSISGFDTQETTTAYDSLDRPTTYKDADGNEAKTTYDYLGRPVMQSDGKGTQTLRYDPVTGVLVELEDSAAGTFTASYDADGQMVKQGLPNGLTREMTVDEAGEATGLTYTKASNCGISCTWLSFTVQRSIRGQILVEDGTLGKDEYAYDRLGRLKTARETLIGGSCTTRTYEYDKDSNRTAMAMIPGVAGTCSSSGGTARSYSYDSADRLLATGLTYDDFGRITSLPGEFVGGKTLSTTYFSNDMVATQTQDGITNSFQLDAMLRQRLRLQAGGLQGTEVFHYAGPSDAPAWTERGSSWTRNITGIGGDLAGIQENGKETELQLINIHGDVSATAALSPAATSLKSTFTYDEFGNRTSGTSGRRFAWLGGKQRRTELASGVVQMGVRSYIPQLGRFLSPDPISGGSANAYDYANQDPVNQFDLTGECAGSYTKRGCARQNKERARAIHNANRKHNKHKVLLFSTYANKDVSLKSIVEDVKAVRKKWARAAGENWRAKQAEEIENRTSGHASATSIPCRDIGLALSGGGITISSAGLATVLIPGVGETLMLIGSGVDLAGVAFDLSHEKGLC
jgi:RHS repeat-associated protein